MKVVLTLHLELQPHKSVKFKAKNKTDLECKGRPESYFYSCQKPPHIFCCSKDGGQKSILGFLDVALAGLKRVSEEQQKYRFKLWK